MENAPGGATILLGADIALDEALWVFGMGSLTINLCSHELSRHLDQMVQHGSVIEVGNDTTLTICDDIRAEGKITGGKTFRGGAIYNLGTLNIIGGELSGNTAVDGGAIWNAGVVHLTNCYLLHNEARRSGGAIASVGGGEVVAIGCRINNNVVQSDFDPSEYEYEGNGGGVLNEGVMTLRDCTIQQNSATYGGGVANRFDSNVHTNNKEATVLISNCDISENTATKQGAGVLALNGFYNPSDTKPSVTVEKSTRILRNTVGGYGGGLYVSKDCTVLLKDSTIAENETGGSGGGIHCEGTLQLSGAPVVKDNMKSQTLENIYMSHGRTLHIMGELKSGTYVSWPVSRFEAQQVITTGYGDFNGDADAAQYFHPYGESNFYKGHTVYTRGNEAMIGANMPYLDENGTEQMCYNYVVVSGNGQKTMSEGWYYVYGELSLSDRAEVLGGHARIILGGNCTATYSKGITVEDGATLSIYRQPELEGKLIAKGEENCAGIGSTRNRMPGNVNIYGGVIETTGGRFGAGIGGGINYRGFSTTTQPNATLHIFGGTVTARGGEFASGIGGGQRMSNPHIVIDGGTVEAHGGSQGTGVGAGANGPVFRSIEINGGDVTAVGGGGAGIGAGYNCEPLMNPSVHGPIILRGGTIKASSRNSNDAGIRRGAGIGGGAYERAIGSNYVHGTDTFTGAGIVVMCGAVVEATGLGGYDELNTSPLGSGSVSTKQLKIRLNYDSAKPDESMDYMVFDKGGNKLLAEERVAACRDSSFVRLEPCDHADQKTTWAANGARVASCKYCGRVGEVCTLTFEPGEGKGKAFTQIVTPEIDVELPDASVFESPDGAKKLVAWRIGNDLYAPKEKVRITQDCTVVAQWTITWASLQRFIDESWGSTRIYLSNDVVATEQDTTLLVPTGKNIMIFLEGHTINRNVTQACNNGTVIRVEGSLEIRDHSKEDEHACITGGNSTQNAGGIYVARGGSLRLFGGHITQNYADKGGGVYVERGGSFDLTSGSVCTNFAKTGGGIYLEGGTCTMTGGDVVDNRATDSHGGGVFINDGSLQMSYGKIVDNAANKWGAGVMVQSGVLEFTHGYIQRNAAGTYGGGIYVSKDATCSLSGYIHVENNRAGKVAGAGNVYLASGALITVPSTLDPYNPIGITTQKRPSIDAPVVLTSGFTNSEVAHCFTSESSSYAMGTNAEGEAILGISQTVSFDAGEGVGDMESAIVVSGSDFVLPECGFRAPAGHEFAGWMVAGESDVRAAGSHMAISRNVTLFATWTKSYELWVAGVRVTAANAENILGDGTARFDENSSTLVLNGFHAQETYTGAMIRASNLDLTVTGNGTVEGDTRGIWIDGGSLTLVGDFTIRASIRPVQASGSTVTFVNGTFLITGNGYRAGTGITATEAVVKNGVQRLQIDADVPLNSARLTLEEDMEVKIPKLARVVDGVIRDSQGIEARLQVLIAPVVRPSFRTHSLSLDGKIGVRFFVELPAIEGVDWAQSHMDFAVGGKSAFQASDPYDPDDKNEAGTYYAFTCYVSSIQMAEPITATFHYTVYDEERSIAQTYSVAEYVAAFNKVADRYDQKIADLAHAMMDYGHYMQIYLSNLRKWTVGTDYAQIDAATEYGTATVDEARTASEPYGIVRDIPEGGEVEKVTFALDLEMATSLYLHVHMRDGADVVSASLADGTPLEIVKVTGSCWRVIVPQIMAHHLGTRYEVAITTSGGTKVGVRASALAFAHTILHSDKYSNDMDTQFAAASIYRYYAAAHAYLE